MNTTANQPAPQPAAESAAHTATPWMVDCSNEVIDFGEGESFSEWLNIKGADGSLICELPGHSQHARGSDANKKQDANAAFIVECVNAHAGLVAENKALTARVAEMAASYKRQEKNATELIASWQLKSEACQAENAKLRAQLEQISQNAAILGGQLSEADYKKFGDWLHSLQDTARIASPILTASGDSVPWTDCDEKDKARARAGL